MFMYFRLHAAVRHVVHVHVHDGLHAGVGKVVRGHAGVGQVHGHGGIRQFKLYMDVGKGWMLAKLYKDVVLHA